jgi:hypothetical protein
MTTLKCGDTVRGPSGQKPCLFRDLEFGLLNKTPQDRQLLLIKRLVFYNFAVLQPNDKLKLAHK